MNMFISLVLLVLALALIGFLVHLILAYVPMPAPFHSLIIVMVIVVIVLYLLAAVLGHTSLPTIRGLG